MANKESKVTVTEVTTGLRLILERVEFLGERFVISRYGRDVAKILPIKKPRKPSKDAA